MRSANKQRSKAARPIVLWKRHDETNVTERSEVMQVSPTTEQTGRCY
jgi:hypothetical protein